MGQHQGERRVTTGAEAGRAMAAMLAGFEHREREDTGTNGSWVLPPLMSYHRWEGGPAWR